MKKLDKFTKKGEYHSPIWKQFIQQISESEVVATDGAMLVKTEGKLDKLPPLEARISKKNIEFINQMFSEKINDDILTINSKYLEEKLGKIKRGTFTDICIEIFKDVFINPQYLEDLLDLGYIFTFYKSSKRHLIIEISNYSVILMPISIVEKENVKTYKLNDIK